MKSQGSFDYTKTCIKAVKLYNFEQFHTGAHYTIHSHGLLAWFEL